MSQTDVPVLIIGGGGAGLTASMLLTKLGVETLLVSSLPTTSILPKAHVLNQRAMEILTDVGAADRVYAVGTPPQNFSLTAWYAGFAGPQPNVGRRIGAMECWGGGGKDPNWLAASPNLSTNLPQIRLEPILKQRAEELAPGKIRFHHELLDFEQKPDHVVATIRDHQANNTYEVRAKYMLGCDGGRRVGAKLGIELQGPRNLSNQVSFYVSADFSKWAPDPEVLIRWIWMPDGGTMVVMVPMGPKNWGPKSEEWVIHLGYQPDDKRAADDEEVERDMRAALGIGDHPMTIHKISRWSMEGILADNFRKDRVFLVGDAAHRHPPTGGLGLNSAIQDAHNICWKLAAVLKGHAGDTLLDSYDLERRPVDGRNVQRSLENAMNQTAFGISLGLIRGNDPAANWAQMNRFWSDASADKEYRQTALRHMATQSMEFNEHNIESGYRYTSNAVVSDGTPPTESPDDVRIYTPDTRPGSPLPHAWLNDLDHNKVALAHLFKPGRFLLIAGEDGGAWVDAANVITKQTGLPVDAIRIGHLDGDYRDPRNEWTRQRQFSKQGAILVRPDRFVAWRSHGASPTPKRDLETALAKILGRDAA